MLDPGQAMLDGMLNADTTKDMVEGVMIASTVCELNAVVGQHGMNGVRHGFDQVAKELCRNHLGGCWMEFGEGKLRGPVDGHEEIEFALSRLYLCDVDMEIADRVAFESFLGWLVALDLRQSRDTVAQQTSVQLRTRQMWDRWLQRIEAVVQRQQRVLAKGNDGCFVFER